MELFRTPQYYIFVKNEFGLWWDRATGEFIPKTGWDLATADDPECLGVCHGIVGKVEHPSVFEPRLLIIKECSPVGHIHGAHVIQKIKSVAFLQLGPEDSELNLQPCQKHKTIELSSKGKLNSSLFDLQKNPAFSKTWGTLKSAGNSIKNTTQQAATLASNQVKSTIRKRENKDKDKFERRIIEEFHKIFTDTNSFYFCNTTDITNSLQRLFKLERDNKLDSSAIWKTVDDRFFWNKHMLQDLIKKDNPLCDPWILPIIQGFVQIEQCNVEVGIDVYSNEPSESRIETFTLTIISRRSRLRAGTRYKRRGVDEDGMCANYVETEQIVSYHHHEVSFVQVRGSVPVYWSQPGYKYRPPPRIDKGEAETKLAFEKHFDSELRSYGPICIVNLVDQTGKEKIIWDSYTSYILTYNNPNLIYVTFDFHEYCRGMHFENVSVLINSVADIIRDINYCWKDKQGLICSQVGVFRVNCIDCLDRTNVVQTAIGKAVMEMQFSKLGLISPDDVMPDSIRQVFQLLWANNGDTISKQYAGTNALKGDYTRTGERKFTGIMKDGMNSANRYYLGHFKDTIRQYCIDLMQGQQLPELELDNIWTSLRTLGGIANELVPLGDSKHIPYIALGPEYELAGALYYMSRYYLSRFKDAYRQGTIDIMLGNAISDDVFSENRANFEEDNLATAEHVKLLIEDSKKMLISEPDMVLGSWGLIDADPTTGDFSETEMDSILILTRDSYYVAEYDDQVDRVTKYQRVELKDLILLECGLPESSMSLFKNTSKTKQHYSIRLNYKVDGVDGYYHMFRSTNLRFFNNLAVIIKNEEEENESLKAICEAFLVAIDLCALPAVPFQLGQKLDRKKSKTVNMTGGSSIYLDITNLPHLTRNVSETQLLAIKSAGSKALSNMSEQISKLNRFGQNLNAKSKFLNKPKFTIGKSPTNDKSNTSSESEEDSDVSLYQPRPIDQMIQEQRADEQKLTYGGEDSAHPDSFLPSVGIVMRTQSTGGDAVNLNGDGQNISENKDKLSITDDARLSSVTIEKTGEMERPVSPNPEIRISESCKAQPPSTLKLDRKLSHSSGEVDSNDTVQPATDFVQDMILTIEDKFNVKRSSSEQDIVMNLSTSQSESALRHIKTGLNNITSPVASVTKDLVLSPFSKLAKGMQNLGANLDPRKISKTGLVGTKQISERELEEHRKLQEKWKNCKTRLIAL
ncbi:spermathreecae [Carabus blaptoides fortunei]